MEFSKWHGLGNDFVLLDQCDGGARVGAERARQLCDRHRGIGGDGVLTLLPSDRFDARLHIYNADGSEAAMCGNGARCVAAYLFAKLKRDEIQLETAAGVRVCTRENNGVRVAMGPAIVADQRETLTVAGRTLDVRRVSIGNAHAVSFWDEPVADCAALLGPWVARAFDGGVNAEFARAVANGWEVSVWERGAGLTEACGTGACATVAAAIAEGRAKVGVPQVVYLPGGALTVEAVAGLSEIWMTGPAVHVFDGVIESIA